MNCYELQKESPNYWLLFQHIKTCAWVENNRIWLRKEVPISHWCILCFLTSCRASTLVFFASLATLSASSMEFLMLVYALKAAVALKDRFFASARILQKPQTQGQIGELLTKNNNKQTNKQWHMLLACFMTLLKWNIKMSKWIFCPHILNLGVFL